MSFQSFIWMLENKTLHFTRPDQFDDSFECIPLPADQGYMNNAWAAGIKSQPNEYLRNAAIQASINTREFFKSPSRQVVVNCWYCAEHESMAMWKLYGNDHGIAVRSSV